ncbi:MAG: hypothetical protein OER86_01655 [Phycisphaerae bacterium]|nr:hypothetical protein [Phycisphaerae bacterium]
MEPSSKPYTCVGCGRSFPASGVVNDGGEVVCRECLVLGAPPEPMDPQKKRSILAISLAVLPIVLFLLAFVYLQFLQQPFHDWLAKFQDEPPIAAGPNGGKLLPDRDAVGKRIDPGSVRLLDALVSHLLRPGNVLSVGVPVGPDQVGQLIGPVAQRKGPWKKFVGAPADPVGFLRAEFAAWPKLPPHVDILLASTQDGWSVVNEAVGRVRPEQLRAAGGAASSAVAVDLVEAATDGGRLHKLANVFWLQRGYLAVVMSDQPPRGYIRGLRLDPQAFLDAHQDTDGAGE